MNNDIYTQKKEIRALIKRRKGELQSSERDGMSETIMKQLELFPAFQSAKTVFLYYALPDEVDTRPFLRKWGEKKTFLLPVIDEDVMKLRIYHSDQMMNTGRYHIYEPTGALFDEYDKIDLAVIPGVAFDKQLNRLGRGKAYYDKVLPLLTCPKIGLCFTFQIVTSIPTDEWDVQMNYVIAGDSVISL